MSRTPPRSDGSPGSALPTLRLRPATRADLADVVDIWHAGWQDAHLGHVPDELVRHRSRAALARLADHRVAHTIVVAGNTSVRQLYLRRGWRDDGPFDNPAPTADGPLPVLTRRYTKRVQVVAGSAS